MRGNVVCIDPGTSNTGIVYMSPYHVLCCKTFHGPPVRFDQDALRARAGEVARCALAWIADKPHEAVVVEGFVTFGGKTGQYVYQTPYLVGYLHRALEQAGESIVVQTSREVLNPRSRGAVVSKADADGRRDAKTAALERSGWGDVEKCTNDHTRAAALHGVYYYGHAGGKGGE